MEEIPEPANKISKDAVKVWRISNFLGQLITILIGGSLIWVGIYFNWYQWIVIVLSILLFIDIIYALWEVVFQPTLLQKYWRYHIDEEFIQMKYGVFITKHLIIPMTKVQYVEAKQGPLLRKYNLHTLSIGTMQSSSSIPALPEQEALALRKQIAHHAKIKEVEEI